MAVVLPDGVDAILDLIGVGWPNVDEDAYRDMAKDLRDFADDVDEDAHAAHQSMQRLISSGESEALGALNGYWGKVKDKHLKDLGDAARIFADAMDAAADVIEGRKWVAVGELTACAASAGLSLAAAPFTAGLSTLIGAGAIQACRIAVKRAIKEMLDLAVQEIVTAMTQPAVAALENMAAELVVQLAANGLGIQDGVDTGAVTGAGRQGFADGVQSGKEALHLASAGGPGPGGLPSLGGMLGRLDIDEGEHDKAALNLNGVSTSLNGRTRGKLDKAKASHGRTRGRDDIAQAIDTVADTMMGSLERATRHLGDHLGGGLPKGVRNIAGSHQANDRRTKELFDGISTPDGSGGKKDGGPGAGGPRRDGAASHPRTRPDSLRTVTANPRTHAIPLDKKTCLNDPVDVATGEMTLSQTDLDLPGVLPLVLRRTHLSNYRWGHWFGRSWASTLDERLHVDGDGTVIWAREDGSLLTYPRVPEPGGEPVWPLEGPRLPLVRAADEPGFSFAVTDPHTGWARYFARAELPEGIFDAPALCWLTALQDRNGNRVEIVRGPDDAPAAVVHSGGYRVEVGSGHLGGTGPVRVTGLALHTPDGPLPLLTYGYDPAGNLDAVTNSSGLPLRFTYDAAARLTSWTDRNDSTFAYVYDDAGRVVRTIGPDGILSSTFAYTANEAGNQVTRYTDSTGAVTTLEINALRQVLARTDAAGHTVRQTWDDRDHLLTRTDALGRTTAWTYDEHGNITEITLPDGSTAMAAYNELNLPVEITAPDGTAWRQTWDERGNHTAVIGPDGTTTAFACDGSGALSAVTDPAGGVQYVTNDAAGLPLTVTDPDGHISVIVRDAFGRPIEVTDPLGAVTRLEWTVEGLPARRTAPDGTRESWTWDGEGNCTSHTDANGGTTRFEHTHFDKLAARTGPDGARYTFAHDTELRLTQVTDPQGLTWSYAYDRLGRLISETDFDGRTVTYAHDAAGRLTSYTTPLGHCVRYEHDVLDRLISKDVEGVRTEYAYDASGHLIRTTSPSSTLVLERDVLGRVLAETVDGRTTRFTHDAAGRRTSRTTPTGAVTELAYDAAGNRTALTASGHTLTFTRDALGRERERSFGTADRPVTLSTVFNVLGSPAEQTLAAQGRTLRSRAYTYRPDGHLTSVTDRITGTTRHVGLDAVGRPLTVTAEDWSETYAYDAVGNQTSAHWPDAAPHPEARGERTYDGTRVLQAGRVRYTYDAAGRTVLRQKTYLSRKPETWRYAWDAEDRLVSVTTPDGTAWRYRYDPLGRRTAKQRLTADGEVAEETLFTWDGTRLAEETNTATHTVLTWDHDGHRPLAQTERLLDPALPADQAEIDRRFFAIVTDLVGTPTELVDETGEIAWHTRTTLWGTTTWNRDATAYTPLRFPGQYADPETGLHYNHFRHYDPDTGRYTTPDPLGLTPAPNPVTYVHNPHTWTDPLGLAPCDETDPGWGGRVQYGDPGPGGRATSMHATIAKDMLGGKTNPQVDPAGWASGQGYNRAHLLAAQLGGSNKDVRNFVTMHEYANSPVMRSIENQIKKAVKNDEIIQYSVTPIYRDDNSRIPLGVTIEAYGDKGFTFTPRGSTGEGVNIVTILNVKKR